MPDVTGILRRVRRLTGLSQRELAEALEVSQSRIARAEASGDCAVSLLQRSVDLVGLQLAVGDHSAESFTPMRSDGARNRCGSRLPPYVDPVAIDPRDWQMLSGHYDRPAPSFRFELCRTQDVYGDHPADSETHDVLRRRRRAWEESRPPARWSWTDMCSCGPECERECLSACECQCEPEGISRGHHDRGRRDTG